MSKEYMLEWYIEFQIIKFSQKALHVMGSGKKKKCFFVSNRARIGFILFF